MVKEWVSKFNPFNSDKLFAHLDKWKTIKESKDTETAHVLAPPVTVTVDPINRCNLSCNWCNSDYILKKNNKEMSKETLQDIAETITTWGVKSVCIAGGGEPLLSKNIDGFIERLDNSGVKVGVVTNGTHIDKHLEALARCDWVGVSVDAGTPETYRMLKGKDRFTEVINNIGELAKKMDKSGGLGVSYKYLLHPDNVKDVYRAAQLAKLAGCNNLHIRPFGEPWDKVGKTKDTFSYSDIQEFQEQIEKARKLESDDFKVYGVTHKFDGDFRKSNDFEKCHAIFMTGVFMPPSGDGNFDYGFCCDRRGDAHLTITDCQTASEIRQMWGTSEHWKVFERIKVDECPRCTYQPHNQIFEKAIEEDSLTYDFI